MSSVISALTFEQRGSSVPFDDPSFADTRVRERMEEGKRQLDGLILGYSGTRRNEVTVVPWAKLQSLQFMADRDFDLQLQIYKTKSIEELDPIAIRTMALKSDAIFGSDDEKRSRALKMVELDKDDEKTVRMSCIAELTRECGIAMGDKMMMRTKTQALLNLMENEATRDQFDLDGLVDRVVGFAAEKSGRSLNDARAYLDPLVAMMTPLGSIAEGGEKKVNGFLYRTYTSLLKFRGEIADLRKQEIRPELLKPIEMIMAAADDCIPYVAQRLDLLNKMMGHLALMFDENKGLILRLHRLRRDVAYGLDGWDILILRYQDALAERGTREGDAAFEETVFKIGAAAPRIPPKERDPNYELVDVKKRVEMARYKMIKELHSWSDNILDTEMQARVELGRERAKTPVSQWEGAPKADAS